MPCAGDPGKFEQERSDIANFRRVCKASEKILQTFTGPVRFNAGGLGNPSKLSRVSAILPGLNDLTSLASFAEAQTSVHTFTALSSLTLRQDYENWDGRDRLFDIACLPASLKALELSSFHLDASSFGSIQCRQLTRIALSGGADIITEIYGLLRHLPDLKVSLSCSLLALIWMTTQIQSRS